MAKYLDIAVVQQGIAGKFQTLRQYEQFVIENNLKAKGFPTNPISSYGKKYPGVDAFLGNPEGTNKAYVKEKVRAIALECKFWVKGQEVRKQNRLARIQGQNSKPKPKPQPAIKSSEISMVDITNSLLERNVSVPTLLRLVDETQYTVEEAKAIIALLLNKRKTLV